MILVEKSNFSFQTLFLSSLNEGALFKWFGKLSIFSILEASKDIASLKPSSIEISFMEFSQIIKSDLVYFL